MYTHEFKKRVRYGETDQMGYLYYGNYAQYYEIGRVESIRSLGLTYKGPGSRTRHHYAGDEHDDALCSVRPLRRTYYDPDDAEKTTWINIYCFPYGVV